MGLFGPSKGTPESAQELILEFLQSRELDADQALVLDHMVSCPRQCACLHSFGQGPGGTLD